DPAIRVNLGNTLLDSGNLQAARDEYEAALAIDPGFAPAHQGLSYVFAQLGLDDLSRSHRERGFTGYPLSHVPYRGTGKPLRVVTLTSAAGGNFNAEWFLDPRRCDVVRVAAEYADAQADLPPHDVLVNAIGDADLCARALEAASALIARSSRRVINSPAHVALTGRVANAERLRTIPEVRVPRIASFSRLAVLSKGPAALLEHGFGFPVLLRSLGHNTGRHFVKVDCEDELQPLLEALPGETVLAIEFVDLAGPDGYTRKYRMLAIDGVLFPVHAAVSSDWKVHLFSASTNALHRQEDARFLEDPARVLSHRVLHGLQAIAHVMQLEYAGVDFGVDSSGHLVLFEANATMSIPPVDPGDRFEYRRPAIERIYEAFSRMVGVNREP
ncbi:MAG: hypothetical protein KGR26_07800, partial [Cyanobacteria bacterium REEB65]|nr:hypothetical protein [Cyanobacteria bacterium REEB65]